MITRTQMPIAVVKREGDAGNPITFDFRLAVSASMGSWALAWSALQRRRYRGILCAFLCLHIRDAKKS